jgi:hypothetical protein
MTIDIAQDHAPARIVGGIPYFDEYLRLAERISKTAMVPATLRGKPDEVLAVVMYGAELGIGPMQALQQINFISGKPSAAAELLRALVMEAGHQFILVTDSTKATARCRRKDWDEWQETTFTMDDAHRANLGAGDGWKKYPDQMLGARVTSKACRMWFADVIAGMSYTPEEVIEFSAPAPTKRQTAPRKEPETVQRSAPVDLASETIRQHIQGGLEQLHPEERAQFAQWWENEGITRGIQNLTSDEANIVWGRLLSILEVDGPIVEGEVVEPSQGNLEPSQAIVEAFGDVEDVTVASNVTAPSATPAQIGKIRAMIGNGDPHERASAIVKRPVASLKDLTKAEASHVIQSLS